MRHHLELFGKRTVADSARSKSVWQISAQKMRARCQRSFLRPHWIWTIFERQNVAERSEQVWSDDAGTTTHIHDWSDFDWSDFEYYLIYLILLNWFLPGVRILDQLTLHSRCKPFLSSNWRILNQTRECPVSFIVSISHSLLHMHTKKISVVTSHWWIVGCYSFWPRKERRTLVNHDDFPLDTFEIHLMNL